MPYNVFPTFARRGWNIKKRPYWNTLLKEAASGAQYATQLMQYPLYEMDLEFPSLTQDDFHSIVGFYNQQGGSFLPFYISADNDNSVTAQQFGTGDGSTAAFQLTKPDSTYWSEPVGGVVFTGLQVFINGTLTSAYTVNESGLVTFNTIPAPGAALTWTGNYYYLVRFKPDLETDQFMAQLYKAKTVTLRTAR